MCTIKLTVYNSFSLNLYYYGGFFNGEKIHWGLGEVGKRRYWEEGLSTVNILGDARLKQEDMALF